MASSTSRPHLEVATSAFALNSFFRLNHVFLVATSVIGLGDVVTWKYLTKELLVATPTSSCDLISSLRLISSGFCWDFRFCCTFLQN